MKLSIITINYNNRDGLRKTLESVRIQTTREFEYIVIDGGSTDGSVDVIKEYSDIIDFWVSEPDNGIYNAMNKGVAVAHGEYCQFINSGDWLYNENVIEKFIENNRNEDIICGNIQYYSEGVLGEVKKAYNNISLVNLLLNTISHPASFIRHTLLTKHPYDESLKIVSDWKFFIETLILENASYSTINQTICVFDLSGISNRCAAVVVEERHKTLHDLFPNRILHDYECLDSDILSFAHKIKPFNNAKKTIINISLSLLNVYIFLKRLISFSKK